MLIELSGKKKRYVGASVSTSAGQRLETGLMYLHSASILHICVKKIKTKKTPI